MPTFNPARWSSQAADINYQTQGISGPMPVARRQPEDPDKVQLRDEMRVMRNITQDSTGDVELDADAMRRGGVRPELTQKFRENEYQARTQKTQADAAFAKFYAESTRVAIDMAESGNVNGAREIMNRALPKGQSVKEIKVLGSGKYSITMDYGDGKDSSFITTKGQILTAATSSDVQASLMNQIALQNLKDSRDPAITKGKIEGKVLERYLDFHDIMSRAGGDVTKAKQIAAKEGKNIEFTKAEAKIAFEYERGKQNLEGVKSMLGGPNMNDTFKLWRKDRKEGGTNNVGNFVSDVILSSDKRAVDAWMKDNNILIKGEGGAPSPSLKDGKTTTEKTSIRGGEENPVTKTARGQPSAPIYFENEKGERFTVKEVDTEEKAKAFLESPQGAGLKRK